MDHVDSSNIYIYAHTDTNGAKDTGREADIPGRAYAMAGAR